MSMITTCWIGVGPLMVAFAADATRRPPRASDTASNARNGLFHSQNPNTRFGWTVDDEIIFAPLS
jgi:hypothetical protein